MKQRNAIGLGRTRHNKTLDTKRWTARAAVALLALLIPASVATLWAVSTQFWTTATYEDFSRGDFKGISLGRDGSMALAPQLDEVFDTGQAMIWAVARDTRGDVYLGTGHSGKVYRLAADLKGTVIFDSEEPDIFALAVDKDNRLYVGTSPDGKIYRIDAAGKSSEFFDPKTKYIWAMSFAPDGNLYVGTGDRGRVFKVQPNGTGSVFYETNQTNVMSLAMGSAGDLIAGTEPNGLLYKISSSGKAFVIYDGSQAEIHQIELGADGSIYAAVLGGAEPQPQRLAAPAANPQPGAVTATTTITVRAADDPLQMPGQGGQDQPDQQPGTGAPNAAANGLAARLPGLAGRAPGAAGRSAIVRISADGTVETLWKSASENAFDLISSGNRILFSTDEKGRVYQLTNGRDLSLLTQTDQEQTTRVIPLGTTGGYVLTTANLGKVYRMGTAPAATGTFESDIRDAGNIADWGQIRWHSNLPAGTGLELFTRTGNSPKPDATWSEWSKAYKAADGEPIQSPPARYAQWKAAFHADKNQSPTLEDVTLAYLSKNRAPEITEIKATPRSESASPMAGSAARGITIGGGQASRVFSGVSAAARQTPQRGVDISWLASDPDQDDLVYTLYFRGEGETEWKVLQGDLKQNYFQLNPDSLPDGKYRLKVVASDESENSVSAAKTTDRISGPFLVDFTAPAVTGVSVSRVAGGAVAKFQAADASSALVRAEYALDSDPLQVAASDDGIIDSPRESFTIRIGKVDNQEHLLTLRVYDAAGNVGTAKAVIPPTGPAGGQ